MNMQAPETWRAVGRRVLRGGGLNDNETVAVSRETMQPVLKVKHCRWNVTRRHSSMGEPGFRGCATAINTATDV